MKLFDRIIITKSDCSDKLTLSLLNNFAIVTDQKVQMVVRKRLLGKLVRIIVACISLEI